MDELARRKAADRVAVFTVAASEQKLPPHILEKDFWVCWLLKRLFESPMVDGMVFKGGTSLSKGWDAIQRFSEDVDLTLPRANLPETASIDPLERAITKNQRSKRLEALNVGLATWCGGTGVEVLRARVASALGTSEGWSLVAGGEAGDTLTYSYPQAIAGYTDYVPPSIRLEFGVKMPVTPASERIIRPYASIAGRYTMTKPEVAVQVLAPERTFWEKATLIHEKNNRGVERIGDRVSRHYADLAALWVGKIGPTALDAIALLRTVANEKDLLYPSAAADYPSAADGRIRLVPPTEHEVALRRDYGAMREMYFEEPMPFDSIMEKLAELQDIILTKTGT